MLTHLTANYQHPSKLKQFVKNSIQIVLRTYNQGPPGVVVSGGEWGES